MRATLLIAVAGIAVAGCSGGGGGARTEQPSLLGAPDAAVVAPAPAAAVAPIVRFPGAPDTPAGRQLSWVLDGLVTRGGTVTTDELAAHFHPRFLAQVPLEQLAVLFVAVGPQLAGATLESVADAAALKAVLRVPTGGIVVSLKVEATTGQIEGLWFEPERKLGPKPTSFVEAESMLATIAPKASVFVAQLDRGRCQPRHAFGTKAPLAIGSAFKLYVLLGLADRILAGRAAWSDDLAVRDDWKSLPSGITQDVPAGTQLPLRELADRMISLSDNTATDHLLHLVGRTAVEAAMRSTKLSAPALQLSTPVMSTRELFALKLGPAAALDAYAEARVAQRRKQLAALPAALPDVAGAVDWTTARRIDRVEWFATGADLCRVMGTLWQRAQKPAAAPLLDVLAKNPGLPLGTATWPYIGFKGGSEPGVLAMAYLLKRVDGAWFVVAITFNAEAGGTVDEGVAVGYVQGVIELLGSPDADRR